MQSKNNIIRKLTKLIKTAIKGNLRETEYNKRINQEFLPHGTFTPEGNDFRELLQYLSPFSSTFDLTDIMKKSPSTVIHNFYVDPQFSYFYDKITKYSADMHKLLNDNQKRKHVLAGLANFLRISGYFAEHSQFIKDRMYGSFKDDRFNPRERWDFLRKLKNTYGEDATGYTVDAYYSGIRYYAYSKLADFIESYLQARDTLPPDERGAVDWEIRRILKSYYPRFYSETQRGDIRYLPDFSNYRFWPTEMQELIRRLRIHAAVHRELYEVATQLDDLYRRQIAFPREVTPVRKIPKIIENKLHERYNKLLEEIDILEKRMPIHDAGSYQLSGDTT
jgi:energy-converting hydrogenase Eha subunit F